MTEKSIQQFTCTECHKEFSCLGIASRPHRFCPNCKHNHVTRHNEESRQYHRKHRSKINNQGKSPFTVIRHDDPAGAPFRPGAHFDGTSFREMVKAGYAEGMTVKKYKGGVFEVRGGELREVEG